MIVFFDVDSDDNKMHKLNLLKSLLDLIGRKHHERLYKLSNIINLLGLTSNPLCTNPAYHVTGNERLF
jgi:hypothetical protein